jgi:hypothetical protein
MPLPNAILWLFSASLITSLICLVGLMGVWFWFARQTASARQQISQLEQKVGVATSGAIGMGNRIVALERKLRTLQEKQETIGGGDEFAYSQALQMFEQGADVATVASNCGFSASEAQLMALVQQQLRKPGKPAARKTLAESSHDT